MGDLSFPNKCKHNHEGRHNVKTIQFYIIKFLFIIIHLIHNEATANQFHQ